jgi:hypothetical protein
LNRKLQRRLRFSHRVTHRPERERATTQTRF